MRVPLSLACGAYDRTAALARGDIRPEGIDLTFLALPVEETFFRMTRHREFDVAEMSLSSYLISLDQGAPFVAIPAFVSRAFRHNGIYVGAASEAVDPAGLAGGVVGVAEYQLTANVWIRGILAERHGLPVTSVRYRTGGLHAPGRVAKLAHDPPPGVEVEPIPPGATLAETAAGASLLPWAYAEAERTRDVMGADFWTYGLAGNEDTLATFVRYSFEQGLISREREPAELFAPETREAYVV